MPVALAAQARGELDALVLSYAKPSLPGTVVSIVDREGKELYIGSSGPANVETNEPMRPDTVNILL